jgi:hypothetical protein
LKNSESVMEDIRSTRSNDSVRSSAALVALLLLTFLIRVLYPGQPLVENYVGRQIPTAMVARNLDRGSGVLRPQLETAPFPNYFVVEAPIYECLVVGLKRSAALGLPEAGRTVSALLSALAAWGLFELARRREGTRVALLAVLVFSVFPLSIRYGRAFQPDASMLGATVAGMACWDRSLARRSTYWRAAGWCLLAIGFAIKITSAFLLIPLCSLIWRRGRRRDLAGALATLVPALLWYAWASYLVGQGVGSRASADNRSIWLALLGSGALFDPATIKVIGWSLLVRAFTPVGAGLALVGLWKTRQLHAVEARLWWVWGGCFLAAMALLAGKLHHEYYWLPLAPVAAVGVACAIDLLSQYSRAVAGGLSAVLVVLCLFQARSTWQTPAEWGAIEASGRAVSAIVPRAAWVAAPEALLFQSDRRGCRMEWTGLAARRAAGEWGENPRVESPLELIHYYRERGARYFADLGSRGLISPRKGLHDAVRQRYKVIVDSPEVLIAELSDSGTHWNAN